VGAKSSLSQVTTHPGNCEIKHKIYLRHAEIKLLNVGGFGYNTLIPTNERHEMSNVIRVPHTINFMAEINIDKVEASLLPTLISLSPEELTDMVKQTTIHALGFTKFIEDVNEGSAGFARLTLAE